MTREEISGVNINQFFNSSKDFIVLGRRQAIELGEVNVMVPKEPLLVGGSEQELDEFHAPAGGSEARTLVERRGGNLDVHRADATFNEVIPAETIVYRGEKLKVMIVDVKAV